MHTSADHNNLFIYSLIDPKVNRCKNSVSEWKAWEFLFLARYVNTTFEVNIAQTLRSFKMQNWN